MAIIYYLVAKTNSAIVLTAATLIAFLPQACLGPFAGAVVERHSRKSVMIGADLGIAAAGGILALMALFMELPVWAIMAILFIRSTETAFRSLAFSATTSLIVSTEELTKCAGYTQTIWAVSSIISPAAAFLYSLWPLIAIILLCSSRLHNGRNFGNSYLQSMCRKEKPTICAGHKRGLYDIKKKPGTFALLWIGVIYVFLHANQFALSSPYRVLF